MLWAQARDWGNPTAKNDALDGDTLNCAQVFGAGCGGGERVVATTNAGHLSLFVDADERQTITGWVGEIARRSLARRRLGIGVA